ncbi:hypothetical protein [Blastococcus saxobsidens]|uniref:hypothetical protein n=1 Tax=Blastococcus saxobsidens TaxID=138336 RepID=UPI00102CE009|nr:hypothetical protein [Blastococcus saxobsidens]
MTDDQRPLITRFMSQLPSESAISRTLPFRVPGGNGSHLRAHHIRANGPSVRARRMSGDGQHGHAVCNLSSQRWPLPRPSHDVGSTTTVSDLADPVD